MYHPQLAYCIVQFLEKDAALTEEVSMSLVLRKFVLITAKGRPWPFEILAKSEQYEGSNVSK